MLLRSVGSLRNANANIQTYRSGDVMKALMTPFVENDFSVWTVLRLMRHRMGTSELDKIAGLVYCFNDFKPPTEDDGSGCPWVTVVHTNGIHYFRAKFCGCTNSPPRHIQFLDTGFYPATKKKPRTVFTFHVLDDFYMENLECKTAARNYYSKLRRLTSRVFSHLVPVSILSATFG